MKHTLIAVAALLAFASPVYAQSAANEWTKDGVPIFTSPALPDSVREQIRVAYEHAGRTWDETRDAGGCNADFIPTEIASYCFNHATNKANPNGPIGASDGGSD